MTEELQQIEMEFDEANRIEDKNQGKINWHERLRTLNNLNIRFIFDKSVLHVDVTR